MPAAGAPPTGHDDREDLHGEVNDQAHSAAAKFVTREAAVRFAPHAAVAIATPLANRLAMLIEGFQN